MININTLNKLEELGIGADIDKLESTAALVEYSSIMGNCIVSEDKKQTILELLKQLKPTSTIFKYAWDMEKDDICEEDKLFIENGINRGTVVDSIDRDSIRDLIYSVQDNSDIIAYALPDGIDIRIVYKNGLLFQATTYNKDEKGKDITDYIRYIVPYNVYSIQKDGLLEVRAVLTIQNSKLIDLEIKEEEKLEYIVKYITQNFFKKISKDFSVIAYDFFSTNSSIKFEDIWSKYEYFDNTEFNIAEHALIRDLDKESIVDAVTQLENHLVNSKDRDYTYSKIIVDTNKYTTDTYNSRICINEKIKKPRIYSTTVLNIKWIRNEYQVIPRLDIKPVTIDNRNIGYIDLKNIEELEKLKIHNKSDISFYIDYIGNIVIKN